MDVDTSLLEYLKMDVNELLKKPLALDFLVKKIEDMVGIEPEIIESDRGTQIYLSIKTGQGMELLTQHLKNSVGFNEETDNVFISRRRHVEALKKGWDFVQSALLQLQNNQAGELVAEDLRQAQNSLSEITGEFTSDDLLGKIFSNFCIGK